ncbi:TerB family tellurite resistance protein [Prosthecodimorpha staleyi]|uniref:TerB family tellurite resistance protein n=1 Tax=Prosthecodimorpha staleyi TaxID=2840188 RepID=A0A947GCF9_9HYPH|nr:TerB family tellurite resistance protein [Prosthecodimorpha staleyi]MBT9289146.1 TerB family tellurite resistance protein [Prosthecodimorpha staleyi]
MHIVLAIASLLGVVAFWLIRARSAADAARELTDAAETVGGALRRRKFRKAAEAAQLDQIADPREAAVVLLVAFARVHGDLTERQRAAIADAAGRVMEVDNPTELIVRARWLTEGTTDPANLVLRFTRLFRDTLGPEERRQLVDLCRMVSGLEGPVDPIQDNAIRRLTERLGL